MFASESSCCDCLGRSQTGNQCSFHGLFGFQHFVTSRDTYLSAKALEPILGLPETPSSMWNRE